LKSFIYRLFHTHRFGEQVSGNSLRNCDTTNQEFIGKVCARFEQFLKRHFHRNYSLGKIASRVSSRITATRSLVRSKKGVTFKSMHETAAISDIGKFLISVNFAPQPGTNGGIIAIHGIRVLSMSRRSVTEVHRLKRTIVASGASEDGDGGGSSSSDNTYNGERSM
ncbi:hypothetical protein ALC62_13466, partial [Cyphomyrmex costatus]